MPNRENVEFEARGTAHHKALYSLFSPKVTLIVLILVILMVAAAAFSCWAAAGYTIPI